MLLDDIATYLAANSTRFTIGVNLTKGHMPDDPDTCTTLYETGGVFPLHYFSTSTGTRGYERPGLMVHSRSEPHGYESARAAIEDVFTILDGTANTTLPTATGVAYLAIDAVQAPFAVGPDKNERVVLSVNFLIVKSTG